MSEANVWSRFEFQQLYQSSPLLSPNCFSLKQIPVLNLNCKDSLGFPGYILHKKTFFFLGFNPGPVVRKRVFCFWFQWRKKVCVIVLFVAQMGLVCIFSNVCIIFLFVAQVACFASFQMFASFFWNFGWRALGPDWEFSGIPPAWVLLGGSLFFLGLWEHPKFRGSLFFGTTLEWNVSKSRPCYKSIWVFYILVLGFTASCSIAPWIKFKTLQDSVISILFFCYISFLNCCNYFFQPQSNPPEEGYYFSYLVFFMFCFYVLFFSRNNNIFNIIVYVNSISNF